MKHIVTQSHPQNVQSETVCPSISLNIHHTGNIPNETRTS